MNKFNKNIVLKTDLKLSYKKKNKLWLIFKVEQNLFFNCWLFL